MRRRDLMLSKRLAAQFIGSLMSCPTEAWKDPKKMVERAFSVADAFVRESNIRGEGTGKKNPITKK